MPRLPDQNLNTLFIDRELKNPIHLHFIPSKIELCPAGLLSDITFSTQILLHSAHSMERAAAYHICL